MRVFNRTFVYITLILIAMLPMVSIATYNYSLHKAEILLRKQFQKTDFASREVNLTHGEMTDLAGKYNASEKAISDGNTRTVAAAFGVTTQAFAAAVTGGSSVPYSGIVTAVTSELKTKAEKKAALTEIETQENDNGIQTHYYCPWCGEHYDPNNNYSGACSVLGYHDGFAY